MSDSPDFSMVIIVVLVVIIGYLFVNQNQTPPPPPPPLPTYPSTQTTPPKSSKKETDDDDFFEEEDRKVESSKNLKPWDCCLNLSGYEHSCDTQCPYSYRYTRSGTIATGKSVKKWGWGCGSINRCCTKEEQQAGECW